MTLSTLCHAEKWAIIIGIRDYQNIRDLQYAEKDAEAIKEKLRAGGIKDDKIKFLINENATKNEITNAFLVWL